MRGMALKLGISVSLLSLILKGQRRLPLRLVDPLCALLDIDQIDRDMIVREVLSEEGAQVARSAELFAAPQPRKNTSSEVEWNTLSKTEVDFIADWRAIAIYVSVGLASSEPTTEEIARRLGFKVDFVRGEIDRLIEAGFLEKDDTGKIDRAKGRTLQLRSGKDFKAIRDYHRAHLENAKVALESRTSETDLQTRLITGMTVTVSKRSIPILKQKIQDALLEIAKDCSEDTPEEVYQINVQFFPLTSAPTQ